MKLEAKQMSVSSLVKSARHGFSIPDFQRNYAWGNAQLEQFWADVTSIAEGKFTDHFMGPIVLLNSDQRKPVIDGQQRLTTLVILAGVIRDRFVVEYKDPQYTVEGTSQVYSNLLNELLFLTDLKTPLMQGNYQIKTILDFGSGYGEMVFALSEFFSVSGLEPEDGARERCIKQNAEVYSSVDEIKEKNIKFDLVTLFHVIEHFYTPALELTRIYDLLNSGGYLIVETPNSQDALLTTYMSSAFSEFTYWSHHPMLHSSYSLTKTITTIGFEIVENTSVQRYGLSNHLYWLVKGRPGGHVIWEEMFSDLTESLYSKDLAKNDTCDTLWFIAKKPLMQSEMDN
jgi:SAM-dependent methyltransferase